MQLVWVGEIKGNTVLWFTLGSENITAGPRWTAVLFSSILFFGMLLFISHFVNRYVEMGNIYYVSQAAVLQIMCDYFPFKWNVGLHEKEASIYILCYV